jgi:hypothetical protein
MTPQEEAQDLFCTFRYALSIENAPLRVHKDDIAKQCALIAVDRILKVAFYNTDNLYEHYMQVKLEIDKL